MITRLHSAESAKAIFFAHELPHDVQHPVLEALVTPRVVSSSMMPTLQPEDCLELRSAEALHVGDLVVFRHQALLVCHRILHMDGERLYTGGDAAGGLPENIHRSDVVGRVVAIVRGGTRRPLHPGSHNQRQPSRLHRYAVRMRAQLRCHASRWIAARPFLGLVVRRCTLWLVTVDVMERAPLRSLSGCVKRRSLRGSQIRTFLQSAALEDHPAPISLIFRAGPLVLATCLFSPHSLRLRPAAAALGLHTWIQSVCGHSPCGDSL